MLAQFARIVKDCPRLSAEKMPLSEERVLKGAAIGFATTDEL
jgi:hypothetical protein